MDPAVAGLFRIGWTVLCFSGLPSTRQDIVLPSIICTAGLTFINAVFTYRQRAVRFPEGLYDAWQKQQRSSPAQPSDGQAAAAGGRADDAQATKEARLARAAAVAECIHGATQVSERSPSKARRRTAGAQEPPDVSDESSEASDDTGDADAGAAQGLAARVWDDLVEMEQFWPHATLAVLELAAGALALVAIASCLGAPTLRDKQLTGTAMALLSAATCSLALPIQWTGSHQGAHPSAPEDGPSEPADGAPHRVYHWMLPLQAAAGVAHLPDPLRPGFHRAAVLGPLLAVWAAAVVYPMDWGRAYQAWPLPTVFAAVASFLVCQGGAALGWRHLAPVSADEGG